MILKRLSLAVGIAAMLASSSCNARTCNVNFNGDRQTIEASATMATQTVTVGSFHEIEASRIKVVYAQGPLTQARIEAPENVLPYVKVRVDGGTLRAEIDNEYEVHFQRGQNVTVTVSAPSLDEALAMLAGSVEIPTLNVARDLELEVTTAGTITIDTIIANGNVEAEATTAGTINISTLTANKLESSSTTSGTVTVGNATLNEAEFDVTTAGVVTVAGTATDVDFDATTGGIVNASELRAQHGSAEASTGGNVRCNIASPVSTTVTTGGSVSNSHR